MSLTVFLVSWVIWFIVVQFAAGVMHRSNVAKYGDDGHVRKQMAKSPSAVFIGWLLAAALYALVTTALVWLVSLLF